MVKLLVAGNSSMLEDLIDVTSCSQVPLDEYQLCLSMVVDTSPCHDTATAPSVMLTDTASCVSLTSSPPGSNSAITNRQTEPGLVCKEH